jgi:hypothetical protein
MSKKLITYLILPIAALLLIALLWFIGFCDVIPEVYPVQHNLAWIAVVIFSIAFLVYIGFLFFKKRAVFTGLLLLSSFVGALVASYRLMMKEDAVLINEFFMFERRNYKATYQSTDKSIVLYYYANDTWAGYGVNPGCLWIQDKNSIFRKPVMTDFYSQFYAMYETKNSILLLCSKGEIIHHFFEVSIEKKTGKSIQ